MSVLSPAADIVAAVDTHLHNRLADAAEGAHTISPVSAELMAPIQAFTAGGKRIRALALRWGFELAGGDAQSSPGIDDVAVSIELLHAAALIHDDIIDDSDTRRGMPAVHAGFAAQHRERDFSGDAALYGTGAAIIAGDLCLSLSEEAYSASGLEHLSDARAVAAHDAFRRDVMIGQFLDIRLQAGPIDARTIIDRAMEMLTYKSAKYSVEQPLRLGAALAGADDQLLAALSAFGLPLGRAFQLRDDELGVFGDPAVTGKPAGDDLLQGKRTVLVGLGLERMQPEQRAWFSAHLGGGGTGEEIAAMTRMLDDCGARAAHEELIASNLADAAAGLDALAEVGVAGADRAVLRGYAERLTTRSS